jgi:hypothetical protein
MRCANYYEIGLFRDIPKPIEFAGYISTRRLWDLLSRPDMERHMNKHHSTGKGRRAPRAQVGERLYDTPDHSATRPIPADRPCGA